MVDMSGEIERRCIELLKEGFSVVEIHKKLKISFNQIYRIQVQAELENYKLERKPDNSKENYIKEVKTPKNSKVEKISRIKNEDRMEKRMELYKKGFTDRQIAEYEGVKRETIASWRRRRNMKPNKG